MATGNTWTGFYVGAHIGGGLKNAAISDPFGVAVFGDQVRNPAFIGGDQAGCGIGWLNSGAN